MSKKIYNTPQEKYKVYREKHRETREAKRKALRNTFTGKMKDLLDKCTQRARKKNFKINLDFEFLVNLWHEQDGKCAVSKLPMETISGDRKTEGVNYFTVSVDRINSTQGYTKDNVQLVCFAVNQIKSNLDGEQFKFWLRAISSQIL